jgi:FKBP12-rapamycin complex-associated protein
MFVAFVLEDDDDFGSQFSKSSRSVARSGQIEIQEVLNEKAVEIIQRISNKLTGKDFSPKETLGVTSQVQRLIKQATDIENLAQCYTGWSPYW